MRKVLFPVFLILPLVAKQDSLAAPLPRPVNSDSDDFSPSLSTDGSVMVFSSKRNSKYTDLYLSRLENGSWSAPEPLRFVNSQWNDESPFISRDGSVLLFASDRDGSTESASGGKTRVSFDLYQARLSDGEFRNPIPLADLNTPDHEKSPSLTQDGLRIFFNRWPFSNIQGARIFTAEVSGIRFLNITSLPAPVNSGFQDVGMFPSAKPNEYTFSSRRPGGKGGWDIYRTTWDGTNWSDPVNVEQVNSLYNEIALQELPGQYYFASNRPHSGTGSEDHYDIFSLAWASERIIAVKVRDRLTRKLLPGKIYGNLASPGEDRAFSETGSGSYELSGAGTDFRLRLHAEAAGYLPYFGSVELDRLADDTPVEILLEKEKPDASFNVQSIQFDYDSDKLRKDTLPVLDAIAGYLRSVSYSIEIIGHTDLNGPEEYNLALSERRARAVMKYLISQGIEPRRLSATGAGKSRPLIPAISPDADAVNRRTEFRVRKSS